MATNGVDLRKPNEQIEMTAEDMLEWVKCSEDIYYFLRNYFWMAHPDFGEVLFDPLDFQRKVIDQMMGTNGSGKRHCILRCGRQGGKTSIATGIILWKTIFRKPSRTLCLSRALDGAIDILNRIKFALEKLPKWMYAGVVKYNETSIVFENGNYIYSRATTKNSGRGLTLTCLTGENLVTIRDKETGEIMEVSLEQLYYLEGN
jgi:hypothetical protein